MNVTKNDERIRKVADSSFIHRVRVDGERIRNARIVSNNAPLKNISVQKYQVVNRLVSQSFYQCG